MKRVLSIVLVLGLVAGAAFAQSSNEVNSVNVVGFAKKDVVADGYTFCAIGFTYMGASNGIQEIFGDKLKGAGSSAASDLILKWDPAAQQYLGVWKVDFTGAPTYHGKWVKDDGAFPPNIETNMAFSPGDGFWVVSRQSSNQVLDLVGEVPVTNTGISIVEGYNMIAYPYSADVGINDTTNILYTVASGGGSPGSSDIIYQWDAAGQQYLSYWLVDFTGAPTYHNKWVKNDGAWPPNIASNSLDLGVGFWFVRKSGAGSTTWTPPAPYDLSN